MRYFMRDIQPDSIQGAVMAYTCVKYGWKTVSTINTAEEYGSGGISVFANTSTSLNISISTLVTFNIGTIDIHKNLL